MHGFSLLCVNTEEGRERSGMVEEEGGSGQITCFSTLDTKGKSLVGFVCLVGIGEKGTVWKSHAHHTQGGQSPL